jgi:hypothetical protein
MGLHSTEARLQSAGATEAPDRTIPGRQPGAEAQGIHEERGGLGEVQDEHTRNFYRQASGRGTRGPELALEINPVDGQGQPKKKRGYMVRGKAALEELTKILSDPRLARLAEALEAVNPKVVKSNSRMIEV